ncbi:MAG: penicillin-binding protein activator [Gammaproteobacteria bacterium]|nr:MAG: penicillin-binding protein activator [Gammaproteobacteria bacterium]
MRPGKPPATAAPAAVTPAAAQPRKLALMLPLSGAQRAAGEAIRDGFLAAYLADSADGTRPEVLILDETAPGPAASYQAALDAGVGIVVGPLLKESAAEVARIAGPLPWLALNYLDIATPAGSPYQFALAPEDEARSVAERAATQGQLRALALAPDSEWGRRLLGAFTAALEERGGTVVAYRLYDPAARDYTAQLQRLLLLDESRARHRQLEANLGISLAFEPRRRDDLDCIFLAASPVSGRLLWPQLRFLYAGDLPIYATSAIYQPGDAGGVDREGILFTDAPAVIGSDPHASALRSALDARWPPGAIGQLRFYAMGYDSYTLARAMMAGNSPALMPVAGLSGILSQDASRRIHRRMSWAAFRDGQVVPAGEASTPVPAGGPNPE